MATALPISNTDARIQPANSNQDTKGHTMMIYRTPHPSMNLLPVLDFRQIIEAPRLAREIFQQNSEDAVLTAYYVALKMFGYLEAQNTMTSIHAAISELKAAIAQRLPEFRRIEYVEQADFDPYFPYGGRIADVAASIGVLETPLVAWMGANGWLQPEQYGGNWSWRQTRAAAEEGLLRGGCFVDDVPMEFFSPCAEGSTYVTLKGVLQLCVLEPQPQENGELVATNPFDVDVRLPFWWRRYLPEARTEECKLTINLAGISPRATISAINNPKTAIRILTESMEEQIQLETRLATMIPKIEAFRAYSG